MNWKQTRLKPEGVRNNRTARQRRSYLRQGLQMPNSTVPVFSKLWPGQKKSGHQHTVRCGSVCHVHAQLRKNDGHDPWIENERDPCTPCGRLIRTQHDRRYQNTARFRTRNCQSEKGKRAPRQILYVHIFQLHSRSWSYYTTASGNMQGQFIPLPACKPYRHIRARTPHVRPKFPLLWPFSAILPACSGLPGNGRHLHFSGRICYSDPTGNPVRLLQSPWKGRHTGLPLP